MKGDVMARKSWRCFHCDEVFTRRRNSNRSERMKGDVMARKSWRCFHCDEVFTNPEHAAEHFGEGMHDKPACKLGATKGHLITLIRKLQRELASYRHEDSDIMRSMLSMESEHQQQLIREEEKGYARGLADAKLVEPEHKPPMFDRT